MPKGPQGRKRLYGYLLGVVSVLAFTRSVFGHTIQAWYAAMPRAEATAIGGGIIMGLLALATVAVLFLRNDEDA
jgi:hypothetical protein